LSFSSRNDELSNGGGERSLEVVVAAEVSLFQNSKGCPMFLAHSVILWSWPTHHSMYPNVWKLAQCILSIPTTSAPAERVFTAAANIMNKK